MKLDISSFAVIIVILHTIWPIGLVGFKRFYVGEYHISTNNFYVRCNRYGDKVDEENVLKKENAGNEMPIGKTINERGSSNDSRMITKCDASF